MRRNTIAYHLDFFPGAAPGLKILKSYPFVLLTKKTVLKSGRHKNIGDQSFF